MLAALGCFLLSGCAAQVAPTTPTRAALPAQVAPAAAPTAAPHEMPAEAAVPAPTPVPAASTPEPPAQPAPPPPAAFTVTFAGLSPGAYPTHVHSICNGGQSFHIATVQTLVVNGSGSGSIQLASGYFGNGWCLIVYTSRSLTRVLTTRSV